MTPRTLILAAAWCAVAVLTRTCDAADAALRTELLPQSEFRQALSSPHFPDRMHEFIWRNWTVIEPAKLAEVLGTTPERVTAIAVSMGLPGSPAVSPEMRRRGYATIIRRNWHLLPYAQLLTLLDMPVERLAFTLREEDFLWIKLGRLKPACEPLEYTPPNDAAQARAAEIRAVVESYFGNALHEPAQPRFDFVRQLAELPVRDASEDSHEDDAVRLVYSYVALYGDPLHSPELNPYPDGLLARLADVGINGVWLQGLLRDLAPGGEAFPEFGEGHEQRLANLNELVQRAKTYGIAVYLYLNEPRAMPREFFDAHPDVLGVEEGDLAAMCTSNPVVRRWMSDTLAHIFRNVPELGGIYAITASENLTNCASHGDWRACSRCADRSDGDILVDVVQTLEEGVHRSNPDAKVLISDWGWRGHGDAPDIIARLPESVYLMSVSEWHLPIERGGIASTVGEYSISSVGPGPRSLAHWKAAKEVGLRIGTEIQFNNTCEIATLPYLPVLDLIAEHCVNLRNAADLNAMLIGWTMGGHPSPNFELAHRVSGMQTPDANDALDALAHDRFGDGARDARRAWTGMSEAFREYPFHISVVYTSPVQMGPANLLYPEDTGYSATMWGFPYDDLNGWRGPYPAEVFADQFEKVAAGFRGHLPVFESAVRTAASDGCGDAVAADLRYAHAAAIHFQSVANQARFVAARDVLAAPSEDGANADKSIPRRQMRAAIESERDLARELYDLVRDDSRIGFEPSCQYFYLPIDLVEKVINCEWLLQQMPDE